MRTRLVALFLGISLTAIAAEPVIIPWSGDVHAAKPGTLSAADLLRHTDAVWAPLDAKAVDFLPPTVTAVFVIGLRSPNSPLPVHARLLYQDGGRWFATRPIDELIGTTTDPAGAAQRAANITTAAFAAGL